MSFKIQCFFAVISFLGWSAVLHAKAHSDTRPIAFCETHSTERIYISLDTGYDMLKKPLTQLINAPKKAPFHSHGSSKLYFYNLQNQNFERNFDEIKFDIEGFSNLGIHPDTPANKYKYVDIPDDTAKLFRDLFPAYGDEDIDDMLNNLFDSENILKIMQKKIIFQRKNLGKGILFCQKEDKFSFIEGKAFEKLLLQIEDALQDTPIGLSKFSDSYFSMGTGTELYIQSPKHKNMYELIRPAYGSLRLLDNRRYIRLTIYDFDRKKRMYEFYKLKEK